MLGKRCELGYPGSLVAEALSAEDSGEQADSLGTLRLARGPHMADRAAGSWTILSGKHQGNELAYVCNIYGKNVFKTSRLLASQCQKQLDVMATHPLPTRERTDGANLCNLGVSCRRE